MALKIDIARLRRIDDLDRPAYLAARARHEARLTILVYERNELPYFEVMEELQELHPDPTCDTRERRKYVEADVATARDLLGGDSPERWQADQERIERYLLRTTGNLDEAEYIREWGSNPDTMWAHQRQIRAERHRQEKAKIDAIITKRFAIEQVKGSPVRFDNHPRYGTPVYADGSTGDSDLYPRGWMWPLRVDLHDWICVVEEIDEISLSDEDRLHEIGKFLDEEFDFDVASLCPAPGEQFPRFECFHFFQGFALSG